jgi:hypothetical protein
MMAGAVVLLIGALVPAIQGDRTNRTGWLPNATLIIGYGFLAYGFFLAMRARKEPSEPPKWTGETKSGWSEDDEGSVLAAHDPPEDPTNK